MWKKAILLFALTVFFLASAVSEDAVSEDAAGDEDHHEDHFNLNFDDFFSDANTEDADHLEQHLKEDMGIEKSMANMTDTEKDWYYFKLHDTNEDMQLDGLELLRAWQHHYVDHMGHEGMGHTDNTTEEMRKFVESQNESFVTMVDTILATQDSNNDGYLDYFEYMIAKFKSKDDELKAKDEAEEKKHKKE